MDAYFDMFSGISGNMVLGALIDLGLEMEDLQKELLKLGLGDEYTIKKNRVLKEGIGGTYVEVELLNHEGNKGHEHSHHDDKEHEDHEHLDHNDKHHEHDHGSNHHNHHHEHHHGRNLNDINEIIEKSSLSLNVKNKSKKIFLNLARAEARIHGKEINEIHRDICIKQADDLLYESKWNCKK